MIVGHPWHLTHLCYSNVLWLPCECRSARGGTSTSDTLFSSGALLFAFPIRTYHFSTALVLMWYVYWTIGLPCIFGVPTWNMGKKWLHCIHLINIYCLGMYFWCSNWEHGAHLFVWIHLVAPSYMALLHMAPSGDNCLLYHRVIFKRAWAYIPLRKQGL